MLRYKKILGVPMSVLLLGMFLTIVGVGMGVYAFQFGNVLQVAGNMPEPLSYSVLGNIPEYSAITHRWTPTIWPAEIKELIVTFFNASPTELTVTPLITGNATSTFTGGSLPVLTGDEVFIVPALGNISQTLTLTAEADAMPCSFLFDVIYTR